MSWTVKAADGEIAYYASGHVEIPFHKKLIVARNDAEADQKLDEWAKTFAPNARAMPSEFATGQEMEQGIEHIPSSIQAQDKAILNRLEKYPVLKDAVAYFGLGMKEGNSLSDVFNESYSKTGAGEDKYIRISQLMLDSENSWEERAEELNQVLIDIIGDDPNYSDKKLQKQSRTIKSQENMVKMTGFLLDQKSYLVAADPAVPGAYHTSYYPSEWFESDWAIVEFEIPENEVAKVSTMGTMEQEFSDGYEGWDYVEKLIGNKFSVIEEGEGTSEEFQGEEIPEGAVVKTPEQL